LDEGIKALFLGGAADRLGLGDTERPGAVRGWCHITLHSKYLLERLDIHLGRLGNLVQNAGVAEYVGTHAGFTLLKLEDTLLD
jgi:hypothetical protein